MTNPCFYVPVLNLGVLLPQQIAFEDKFGGLPWGLPASLKPKCSSCSEFQVLVAQLSHEPIRLDLGRSGRILFIFICNNQNSDCSTWDPFSGCNACFVLEPEELLHSNVDSSEDFGTHDSLVEARVMHWEKGDAHLNGTRLGGNPAWIQGLDEIPEGWTFVCQLDSFYKFKTAVPSPDTVGCSVGTSHNGLITYKEPIQKKLGAPRRINALNPNPEGHLWATEALPFGDQGRGYAFVRKVGTERPEGLFCWQC